MFDPDNPSEVLIDGPTDPSVGNFLAALGPGLIVIALAFLIGNVAPIVAWGILAVSILIALVVASVTNYPFESYEPLKNGSVNRIRRTDVMQRVEPST